MAYKPKIVTGKVTGTGWPIDGHVLYFSQWDYDHGCWHLYGWDDPDDEAVMLTHYQLETEYGICYTLEEFTEMWKAGEYESDGALAISTDLVEVLEVIQEEEK